MQVQRQFSNQTAKQLESIPLEDLESFLRSELSTEEDTPAFLDEIETYKGSKGKSRKTTTEIIREDREQIDGRNLK